MAYVSLNFLFRQRLFLLIALLFFQFNAIGQNLVPNPSFEEHHSCPSSWGQLNRLKYWMSIYNSPDYFDKCSSGSAVSIPDNALGHQELIDTNQNSYTGEYFLFGSGYFYSEIIGVRLTEPLIPGIRYYISFYYSSGFHPATDLILNIQCFINNIGIKIISNPTDTIGLGENLIDNTADAYSDELFLDTLNWKLWSASFIAKNYNDFLVIGNFFDKNHLVFHCIDSTSKAAYIYFDEICLSKKANFCFNQNYSEIELLQNPITSLFTIINLISDNYFHNISVYDVLGQLIIHLNREGGEIKLDLSPYSKGVYFILVDSKVFKVLTF